jgi:hypothetical protein
LSFEITAGNAFQPLFGAKRRYMLTNPQPVDGPGEPAILYNIQPSPKDKGPKPGKYVRYKLFARAANHNFGYIIFPRLWGFKYQKVEIHLDSLDGLYIEV